MDIALSRVMRSTKNLTSVDVLPADNGKLYLKFKLANGEQVDMTCARPKENELRTFCTYDAAIKIAKEIGFEGRVMIE